MPPIIRRTNGLRFQFCVQSEPASPEEYDVAEHVVLVLLHLLGRRRRPLRQVLVHQAPPDQEAQQVAERGASRGAETDLKSEKSIFIFILWVNNIRCSYFRDAIKLTKDTCVKTTLSLNSKLPRKVKTTHQQKRYWEGEEVARHDGEEDGPRDGERLQEQVRHAHPAQHLEVILVLVARQHQAEVLGVVNVLGELDVDQLGPEEMNWESEGEA